MVKSFFPQQAKKLRNEEGMNFILLMFINVKKLWVA